MATEEKKDISAGFCRVLLGAFALVALLFHWDWAVRGLQLNATDVPYYYFPTLKNYADWIAQGHFPLWSNHFVCGHPIVAEGQTSLLHPLRLLLLWWGHPQSDGLWLYFHALIGAYGMYFFCRELGSSRLAAVIAAYAFGLSAFFTVRVIHPNILAGGAWIPLALCFTERLARDKNRYLAMAGLAIVSAFQWLSGHPQIPLLTGYFCGLYVLLRAVFFREEQEASRVQKTLPVALTAAALALGLALAAVQVLPLIKDVIFVQSERAAGVPYSFVSFGSLPPWGSLLPAFPALYESGLLAPNEPYWLKSAGGDVRRWETQVYAGALVILLALVALARRRRENVVRAQLLLAAFALLFALGKWGPLHWPLHFLPGLNLARVPCRALLLFMVSTTALAALGFDYLRSVPAKESRTLLLRHSRRILGTFIILLLIVGIGFRVAEKTLMEKLIPASQKIEEKKLAAEPLAGEATRKERLEHAKDRPEGIARQVRAITSPMSVPTLTNLAFYALALLVLLWWIGADEKNFQLRSLALVALVCLDLFWFKEAFGPKVSGDTDQLAPPPYMGVLKPEERVFSLFSMPDAVERNWDDARRMLPPQFNAVWGIDSPAGHTSMAPIEFFNATAALRDPRLAYEDRVHAAANNLERLRVFGVGAFIGSATVKDAPWPILYEDSLVRVWKLPDPLPQAFLSRETNLESAAWKETIQSSTPSEAQRSDLQALLESATTEGLESIPQETPDHAVFEVTFAGPATLVRTIRHAPAWKATLDGEEIPVDLVLGFFQGVRVPAGRHHIEFSYEPASLKKGALASAGSGVLILLLLGLGLRLQSSRKRK